MKHFVPPFYLLDSLRQENGIDRKNKVLSRVHAALKEIADLVPLAPLRLSPIVIQKMPSVFSKETVSSYDFLWILNVFVVHYEMMYQSACCQLSLYIFFLSILHSVL